MPKLPLWNPPKDIERMLVEGEGLWEDDRWSPILLTVMSGTEYQGRKVPVAWQIEFDPFVDDLAAVASKLEAAGLQPDGYGWGEHISEAIRNCDPGLAQRLHTADCESSTCVIWVETEDDCRSLMEVTWKLLFMD